jgi:hypothetical protein
MAALISLEQAKIQCRIPADTTEYDDDLWLKIEQATAVVIDYIKRPDHGWVLGTQGSPEDDPAFTIVQAAILEVTNNLFQHRGDTDVEGPITPRVESMLRRLRDPALA